MTADGVPPEVVARIAANVFDAIREQKRIDIETARRTFTAEAEAEAHFLIWSVEMRITK